MKPYSCRICESADYEVVLDFGNVALANSFLPSLEAASTERLFPLTLVVCRTCLHLQIKEVVDPKLLFSEYLWETGIPSSIHAYCEEFADAVLQRGTVGTPSVFEIASNDGTMLKVFARRGSKVLGVDPAQNIAQAALASGVPTVIDFFGERLAGEILDEHGTWELVLARNVLAHVADLQGMVAGIRRLLAPDGIAVVEVPHLLNLYRELQYDQVYHEHIGYHSLDSIVRLFERQRMNVFDVENASIHGGAIRAYIAHNGAGRRPSAAVKETLAAEEAAGILDLKAWETFGDRARHQRQLLRAELSRLRAAGQMVVGYGAAAKGQSMIQFCDLDGTVVPYIADKSLMKTGKFAPGSHIPIVSPQRMRSDPVNVVVLFAWNLAREILEQERDMRNRGVRFLHPLPEPHYL